MTAVVTIDRAMRLTPNNATNSLVEGWRATCYECTPIWRSEFYPQGAPGGSYISAAIDAAQHDREAHGVRENAPSSAELFG